MRKAKQMALGGLLAALAVVIMTLGGLIPFATYTCPMLCILILMMVAMLCGYRIAWAWYGAVSILSLLLGPDKEAAAVFVALGYYPIIKPKLDRSRLRWLWKVLLFNGATIALYLLLLYIFGMEQLLTDFQEIGRIGLGIALVLGNICFILVDRILSLLPKRIQSKRRHPQI